MGLFKRGLLKTKSGSYHKGHKEMQKKGLDKLPEKSDQEENIRYQTMYSYIERYYKPKNEAVKDMIKELCRKKTTIGNATVSVGFTAISPLSSEEQIRLEIKEKLSLRDSTIKETYGLFNEYRGKDVVKLYEDIQKFRKLFERKGIKATYKEILTIFKNITDKEEREYRENVNFEIIKEKVGNRASEHEIIRKFVEYTLEITDEDVSLSQFWKLKAICKRDLPPLLKRLGFLYEDYNNELNNIFERIVEELKSEKEQSQESAINEFEKSLDSSYEDEDYVEEVSEDVDDELLSEYLDEDIDDETN